MARKPGRRAPSAGFRPASVNSAEQGTTVGRSGNTGESRIARGERPARSVTFFTFARKNAEAFEAVAVVSNAHRRSFKTGTVVRTAGQARPGPSRARRGDRRIRELKVLLEER